MWAIYADAAMGSEGALNVIFKEMDGGRDRD